MTDFIGIYIGDIGVLTLLIFGLIGFLVLRLKLTPELIYNNIKKHLVSNKSSEINNEESSIDLNLSNENKKEKVQEKIENNIKVNKNLNPTIENFSSIKKDIKVSEEKSEDIKIEIKENKEEEVLDDDLIAKNLVKKYVEYDHTLELKNFRPPSVELLKDYDN